MRGFRFALGASCIALAAPAWAQTTDPAPAAQPLPGVGDIIVTAQRRAERPQDVPISLTVQSGEQLAKVGVVDTRGLQNVTPGLSMQSQDGFLQPALRGVTTSVVAPGADNPIAIYLDGVYVSAQNGSVISLPDIEQVTVLKGPQGTLFGRNATGGAIQITTKAPSFTFGGKLDLIGGYYDGAGSSRSAYDLGVQGYVTGPIVNDLVAGEFAFSKRGSNGYGTNIAAATTPSAPGRVDKTNDEVFRGKLLFTPSDNLRILAIGYYTHRRSDQDVLAYAVDGLSIANNKNPDGTPTYPDAIVATKPWQTAFDSPRPLNVVKTYGASLKIDLTTDIGTFTSTSAYSYSNGIQHIDSDAAFSPSCLEAYACTAVRDQLIDKNLSEELIFTSRKFGGLSFVAGAFGYSSRGPVNVQVYDYTNGALPGDPSFVAPPLFAYDEVIKSRALGLFIEGNYDLTDNLVLTAGVRYSYEKKIGHIDFPGLPAGTLVAKPHWTAFTPRVSLRYKLDGSTNIYATFSQGFKSGIIPIGDPTAPPAKPEKITAYEVGFKTAKHDYSFNAAFFYYNYRDLQVQSNNGAGGATQIVNNAASARIYGLDVDGSFNFSPDFSVHGGVSWIPHANFKSYKGAVATVPVSIPGFPAGSDPTDLSGTRLFRTPKLTLSAGATYQSQLGNGMLSISPNIYHASTLYVEATHYVKTATTQVGAEIAYKPDRGPLRYALWGKNLTNNHAFMSASINNNSFGLLPIAPREFGATVTFAF